jgi:hypothetical protein
MTTERETLRIIGSWMEDGRTRLPDHVLDAVLDQLPSTPQHRPARSARRISHVNAIAKYLIAAAAVVVVAIVGFNLSSGPGVGGQPSPSPTATPTPTPRTDPAGDLEAGSYVAHPLPSPDDAVTVTFTVPEGWIGGSDAGAGGLGLALQPAGAPTTGAPGGIAIQFLDVTTLHGDPCRWSGADGDVRVGPAVNDLVEALVAQTAYEVSEPVDVTIGGQSGKRVDIVAPTEPFAGQTSFARDCDDQQFRLWSSTAHGSEGIYVQGPANRWQSNILDVGGTRLVVVVQDYPGTLPEDRAELHAIVDSLVITP